MLKILCLLFTFSFTAHAAENLNITNVQQQFEHFQSSPKALYSPKTLHLIQAYLGAAMLAHDEGHDSAAQDALIKTQKALLEAQGNAQHYLSEHQNLLRLQKAVSDIVAAMPGSDNPLQEPNPKKLIHQAQEALNQSIIAAEAGQLNISGQAANHAKEYFSHALDTLLPTLIGKAGSIISKAATKNGKYYAPITYEAAKKSLRQLKNYHDGITATPPKNPVQALLLAQKALDITLRVKAWRKKKSSHETLWLSAISERQNIAQSLHLVTNQDDAVTNAEIITAIEQLQAKLLAEQQHAQEQIAKLQREYHIKLQQALSKQSQNLSSESNKQLSAIKDAFRAKLARETFEIKRQKKIQALFSKAELSIVANLNGSLVIRLSSLKFATGHSKIDAQYFDLLSRVKDAMNIYADRNIRIEGHTDDRGELKANQKLSLKRAEAVRDFLIAAGANSATIKALGYGEVRPIASNDFAKGREMNRRIDVVIEAAHE